MVLTMKFKVFRNDRRSKLEDVYSDVAGYLEENSWIMSKQIFLKDLEDREKLGCIKVDTNFYLPHLENNNIKENIVVRVDNFKNDILFILVKEDDDEAKNIARNIVKNLLVENKRTIILKSEKNKFEENGIYKKNEFIIHITYRKKTGLEYLQNYAKITPKCIYIGIGCKKNTPYDIIKQTLMKYLFDNNIDMTSIAKIGSIDIKRNEQGIIKLAEKLGIEFITFTSDEIISSRYYNDIPKNDFVKSITGVDSVSLSCAKMLSEDNIIAENFKGNGITLSAGLKLQ